MADDDRLFVAASPEVEATLGYAPASVLGRRIEDLAGIDAVADTVDRWATFIIEGRQDGTFDLLHRDGSVVHLEYQARAHYPIAHFHLSRLWPVVQAAD
ncbi:MAG: PAS domain S-box protein [Candidatus Limnocylindrales bacterium]